MVRSEILKIRILAVTNINMNKISIIGCGWLGLPLGEFLVQQGYSLLGSTTTIPKIELIRKAGIEPYLITAGPTLEGEGLNDFFSSDILIINIPPRRRRPNVKALHFTEVKNVIDAAVKGRIQKIIFCSSTGVYPNTNDVVDESHPLIAQTESTGAIIEIEGYLKKVAIESTILRFSGLVGGDRKAGRFLAGKKNLKNGNAPINLVHRTDCIQVIHEVIRQNSWNEVFNVCADQHPLRKDFYKEQTRKQGLEPPSFSDEEELSYKMVSNARVKKVLGYSFLHPDPNKF